MLVNYILIPSVILCRNVLHGLKVVCFGLSIAFRIYEVWTHSPTLGNHIGIRYVYLNCVVTFFVLQLAHTPDVFVNGACVGLFHEVKVICITR